MSGTVTDRLTLKTCAASGCDNPVPDRNGTPGRPFIYCSPHCRPSSKPRRYRPPLAVDVHQDDRDDANPRSWTVALRRGADTVTIRTDLGRFSATALARDLQHLIHPPRHEGGRTD
jgi:hypothetical protein